MEPQSQPQALPLSEQNDGTWLLNCLGLLCPVPVIKTGRAIHRLPHGGTLVVQADDPGAELDLIDWCLANGHEHLGVRSEGDATWTTIRRTR